MNKVSPFILCAFITAAGCGGDEEGACSLVDQTGCDDGKVCEAVDGQEPACFDPVVIRGNVFDLETQDAVANARVVALDINGAPVSSVAITNSAGDYALNIPTTRASDGTPAGIELTLRADAAGYQTFPGGLRQALPVDTSIAAVDDDGGYVVQATLTDIGLLSLPDATATGTIAGGLELPSDRVGVLVVAEGPGAGSTIADRDGAYVIFNLVPGEYEVAGYARGINYDRRTVTVADTGNATADLTLGDDPTSTLSGRIEIVDTAGDRATSVVLIVESTFDEALVRGASPPGLRAPDPGLAPDVTGDFTIEGVPAGNYVVLASFENDVLVRDPDSCIAGTAIVHQQVGRDEAVVIEDSFKVTDGLEVMSPGADGAEAVSGELTLSWRDDASEDQYDITVVDSFGNVVWTHQMAGVNGTTASATYAGPALELGMHYQFRVLSSRANGPTGRCAISQTEDLRGVFFVD